VEEMEKILFDEYVSRMNAYESVYNNSVGKAQDEAFEQMQKYRLKVEDIIRMSKR